MSARGPVARNDDTAVFFDGTAERRFLLLKCQPNGHFNRPQALCCAACGSVELDPVPASGAVRLVTWVVVPDRPRGDDPPGPPTIPAIVEFEEGPWWWTRLDGADPATLAEGLSLTMTFERPEGTEAVPVFTPVGAGEHG